STQSLCQTGIPVVHLGSAHPKVHSVSAQHYEGISLTTSHLIELGHQNIAYIGHDTDLSTDESTLLDAAQKRFAGFNDTMRKANLPIRYVDCSLSEIFLIDGAYSFRRLWEQSKHTLTAVVCYNDTLAMGAINEAQKLGLSIPED